MMSARPNTSPPAENPATSRRWLWLATLILLIAAFARLYLLAEVPPGLAQDEVLDADIALFIRSGEHALFFSHGYGHEPLYHYWAAPFQALLGDNILSIKLPAVTLGLLLIALTLRWARRDFGSAAALVAGLGLAISWWPIVFSRIGIRPILYPVLLVAVFWYWPLRTHELNRPGVTRAVIAGLFLGLSIYSYTAARIASLIPVVLLVILAAQYLIARRSPAGRREMPIIRAQAAYAAIVALVSLLVYAPLALTLAANPELQQRIQQLEGPLLALRQGDFGPVLNATLATLGAFTFTGDPRWTYSLPGRPLFDWLTAIFFYAGVALTLWRWRQPHYAALIGWLLVALLPSALSPDAPSTVRMIGALPVVYLMPGLAVAAAGRWLRRNKRASMARSARWRPLFLSVLVAVLAVNAYRTVYDGFIRWPADLETRLRYQTTLRDIGRHWQANFRESPLVIAEVFFEPIDSDSLRRSAGATAGARWIQTGAGVAGALVWPASEHGNGGVLYVPEYAPLPPELFEVAGLEREPVFRSTGSPSFAVYRLPDALGSAPLQPSHEFKGEPGGESIIGLYEVTALEATSQRIALASWWRVSGPLPGDLAIFIHVMDDQGNIIAQYDGLDAAADTLQPDDILLQRHVMDLPDELKPGVYSLNLGLYRRGDANRLPLATGGDVVPISQCKLDENNPSELSCRLTKTK